MTYALAQSLQAAVYQRLLADAGLAALTGTAIYDALPAGSLPQTYVALGPEEARARGDRSAGGAEHRFTVTVVTDAAGFSAAKEAAGAICDALEDAPLALTRGRLIGLWFDRARAETLKDGGRSITLRFRARVDDA
ncbi:DUF3168 domain-containing protein [Cribrihabitans neustonicus]|uniref:DUF3168 domain-containing protein n=1 Tax=Cribrihabitans neustonicus TaxID=1429085 RepID=UPI003B5BA02F